MKKISVLAVCAMMILVVGCSKELKVTIKDNIEVEYGDKLDNSILFDKEQSDEDITVKEVKNFDTKKTGEQEIIVVFSDSDEKTKEETLKVTVKDTKKPVIKLKKEKVEITAGDKLAEVLETFTKKGSSVCVVGHIQSSCFTNNKGVIVYAQELVAERIQLLDNRYGMQASVEEIPLEEAVPSL